MNTKVAKILLLLSIVLLVSGYGGYRYGIHQAVKTVDMVEAGRDYSAICEEMRYDYSDELSRRGREVERSSEEYFKKYGPPPEPMIDPECAANPGRCGP
jgi:hypothetical protein